MEVRREPKEGTLVPGSDDLLGSEKSVRCDRHLPNGSVVTQGYDIAGQMNSVKD